MRTLTLPSAPFGLLYDIRSKGRSGTTQVTPCGTGRDCGNLRCPLPQKRLEGGGESGYGTGHTMTRIHTPYLTISLLSSYVCSPPSIYRHIYRYKLTHRFRKWALLSSPTDDYVDTVASLTISPTLKTCLVTTEFLTTHIQPGGRHIGYRSHPMHFSFHLWINSGGLRLYSASRLMLMRNISMCHRRRSAT